MAEAVIFFGGKVKKDTGLTDLTFNHKSGFIASFKIDDVKYTHSNQKNYLNNQTTPPIGAGYYVESEFLQYLIQRLLPENLIPLDLSKVPNAGAGDMVKVSRLKVVAPYTDFCTINSYFWSFDPKLPVLDLNGDIIFRSTTPVPVEIPLSPTATGFYTHNLPLIIGNDFQGNKDDAVYSLALIALQIHRINRDIFPLLQNSPALNTYIITQNAEWVSGTIFFQPTYEDILQYEESLTNYYNSAYSNQLLIYNADQKTQLFWLAIVLSASGLAVLPIDLKLDLLSQILDFINININYSEDAPYSPFRDIAPDGPGIIVKIVESVSVTPASTDYFLNRLLDLKYTNNGVDITLFEALYKNLSDNRIGRRTLGAINTPDYRMAFIVSLHAVWRSSKFNPYYNSPDYTQAANPLTNVFKESYFIANKSTTYDKETAPGVLVYSTGSTTLTDYSVKYTFELENKRILAYQVTANRIGDEHSSTETTTSLYGTYDIYQPVTLIGYHQDPSVSLPNLRCTPLFYLLYVYNYKQERQVDSILLSLAEFAVTFALFGPVSELSYLTELSEVAESATLPAGRVLFSWEVVGGVSRLIQFTAGSFNIVNNYIQENSDDPQLRTFCKSLNEFLSYIALGAMAVELIAMVPLILSAGRVTVQAAELGDAVTLDRTVVQEIAYIANIEEIVNQIRSKLSSLPFTENRVLTEFNLLEKDEDIWDFFKQFYFKDENDIIWSELNNQFTFEVNGATQTSSLIEIWANDIKSVEVLPKRGGISLLSQYKYMIFVEKDVWEHIHLLKTVPKYQKTKFNPIGGHTMGNFVKINTAANLNPPPEGIWLIIEPTIPGLPTEMTTYTFDTLANGHIQHQNVFIVIPNRTPVGGKFEFNGRVFQRIPKKTEINPSWSIDRIKEEYSFALSNMQPIGIPWQSDLPLYGETHLQIIQDYEGEFTDGTRVLIKKANYAWQNGQKYFDYITYMEIQ